MRSRRWLGALAVAATIVLAGCSGDGVAEYADGAFGECLEDAGVDVSGAEDWSVEEEREVLSRPDSLACALEELSADDRREALSRAFPDIDEDASPEEFAAPTSAVVGYVTERGGEADTEELIDDAAALLNAVGVVEQDPLGPRMAVSLAIVGADTDLAAYDAWLRRTGREDDYAGMVDFVGDEKRSGGALADRLMTVEDQLWEAQQSEDG